MSVNASKGFTLLEMAIVLIVFTIAASWLLATAAGRKQHTDFRATEVALEESKTALYGFALANNRLPCPDTNNNGLEDCTTSAVQFGTCPYKNLGIECRDGYRQRLRYAVDGNFTVAYNIEAGVPAHPTPPSSIVSTLTLIEDTSESVLYPGSGDDLRIHAPAVLFSAGKTWAQGGRGADELENLDNDGVFVFAGVTNFDDVVAWISHGQLALMMVKAGKATVPMP